MNPPSHIPSSNEKFAARPLATRLFISALLLAVPSVAPAAVVFTNFGPGLTYDTTGGNAVGNAFDGNNYGEADTFTLGASANLASLKVALSCSVGCPVAANFTIALTGDAGDQPGAIIESFSFPATTLGILGGNNAPVTANSVLHPLMTAGTQYWVTVTSSLAYSIAWNWNSINDTTDQALSTDGGGTWFAPSGLTPAAFEVDSTASTTVPEPGAGLLLSGGLLACVLCKHLSAKATFLR